MPYFGWHLSHSGGYLQMGEVAHENGADTFAFFPRPPRGGKMRALDSSDIASLNSYLKENNFGPLVAHAPYIYNLAAAKKEISEKAKDNMIEDLERLDLVDNCYYNLHPGSHVGQGVYVGINLVADALQEIYSHGFKTPLLLETMAGKGSELGATFEEIAKIREPSCLGDKVQVCLDTCHIFDGGYDISKNLDSVLDEFDSIIGIEHLYALHLNDSKNLLASHKDRHEKIGRGNLGLGAFKSIVTCSRLKNLPMILETPQESTDGYAAEISCLRALSNGESLDVAEEILSNID